MLTPDQLQLLRREPLTAANKVRRARELLGVTQVVAAAGSGLTQSHLSSIENGDGVYVDTARKLATYFGCLIDDLFPGAIRDAAAAASEAVTQ